MEFTEFAEIIKPIIGGSYSTHVFTRTLFESIITEDGLLQIEDISENTFKAYYNGQTKITKIAKRLLPHIEPEQFISYLEGFPEATTQRLCDAFQTHIEDISLYNASEKIAYLFEEILTAAAAQKRKSTPKSAKKESDKTPHDILTEKVLASGQAIVDVWGNAISNLVSPATSTDTLDVNRLSPTDSAFLERFKSQVEPLLTYCMDHDPTGEGTKLSLADEINDFLQSWKYDVRKIQDACLRKLVVDAMQVLGDYTYYISDKFLRWIPDTDILWFRNESIEEGNQLRDVLRPETIKKRTEMKDIYVRLYPIPEDNTDTNALEIPSEQTTNESPYSPADTLLLEEFTADYDEIMVNPAVQWDIQQYKVGDPILFLDSDRFFPVIHNNMKGIIKGIEILDPGTHEERIQFDVEIPKVVDESDLRRINLELLECWESEEKSLVRFCVHKLKSADEDGDESTSFTVVPFQIAYAVSIHKAQGLEYDSVKIVITDEVEELVTHNIFYTAITRAREKLKIYWTPEVEEKVINRIKPRDISKDVELLRNYLTDNQQEDSFDFWL